MPSLPRLRDIRAKKQALASKIASAEVDLEELRREFSDYEAAERVWLSLSGGSEDDRDAVEEVMDRLHEGLEKKALRRKPSGIPQMPDMILEALKLAMDSGSPGLEPFGMLSYVQQKYWSEATPPDVASTAWRMWKHGKLDKKGKLYSLKQEAPVSDAKRVGLLD